MILFVDVQLPVCMAVSSSPVFIYYLFIMELVPFFILFNLIGLTSAVAYKYAREFVLSNSSFSEFLIIMSKFQIIII